MKYMYVYKTINLIKGKVYVGQHTTTNLDDGYLGSGVLLKKAFRKYGKANFIKEVLCMCESEEELNEMEIYWIKTLKSRSVYGQGYNMTIGGEGTTGLKMSEESKKKLSEVASKRIGELNSFWGKTLSQDHIDKMTKTRVAAITGGKNPSAVRVLCIEENIVFETSTEAAIWCGLKYPTTILKAAKGQRNSAGGYTWKIVPKDDENLLTEIHTETILYSTKQTNSQEVENENVPYHLQESEQESSYQVQ